MPPRGYSTLVSRIHAIIYENKGAEHLEITFGKRRWAHLSENPFQVADELNRWFVRQGEWNRGDLRVSVDPATSALTLSFPLRVSLDGRDDPDAIVCEDSPLSVSE
jgi:hypothetical protein